MDAEVRGFKVNSMGLSQHSDNGIGPMTIELKEPDEEDDVVGGEMGTVIEMTIERGGLRFLRSEAEFRNELTEKFIAWGDILPSYEYDDEILPNYEE